ncbi:hypothetical protein [Dysgonomonas sp. Marseille-P4361]|uniref:hypothetical protein n=1 Tax=Dysgonomonas sp. Marseille-P4361 TaxID=2161820 RepID=UPI000D555089|nr:hypothetical protein [Dysgonomonas sp. Marseille-P4361]
MNFITKKLNIKLFLLLLVYVNCSLTLFSQVTIGVTEEANKGSLLQLKNEQGVTDDAANASKGLLLPRVNLSEKYELFPMFLKDPTDITSGRTTEYNTNKKDYDLQHTGLMVYNMNEDYEKDLCLGVNTWDGEKWNCAHYATYDYEMDCSTIKVSGLYYKNEDLDSSHKITLRIRADEKMEGKTYYIKTDEIDGISFFAQGKITSAAATAEGQEVVMKGKGKSTNREIKRFTLTANNTSGQTCSATVVVVIPTKKVLVLADGYDYGYNISKVGTGSYGIFTTSNNFGVTEESVIKYEGTRFMNDETPFLKNYPGPGALDVGALKAADIANLEYALLNAPEGEKIDIVILSQDVYLVELLTQKDELARVLAEFVNRKGVLIALYEGNGHFQNNLQDDIGTDRRGSTTSLLQKIWGQTTNDFGYSAKINLGSGAVYPLTDVDDEILNGPFGDVRKQYWGEDASWARGVKNIPLNDIIVYSYGNTVASNDAGLAKMITGFRHKTKNFIYFGDGGFTSSTFSGENPTSTSTTMHPLYWKNEGGKKYIPIAKSGYGKHSTKYPVYNSVLFANIMAWAVYQAEMNGINPPQD